MTTAKRNYEWRSIPEVLDVEVTRDGDLRYRKGREKYVRGTLVNPSLRIVDTDGNVMTIQMLIHKAFPDIPMRVTPKPYVDDLVVLFLTGQKENPMSEEEQTTKEMTDEEWSAKEEAEKEADELWWKDNRKKMYVYMFFGFLFLPPVAVYEWIVRRKAVRD